MGTQPVRTTVVVVPRESFNMFPEVVERVYKLTSPIFKMIIMEGNAPEPVRAQLRKIEQSQPGCKIVWSEKWLYPHEAVNQALPLIDTEYVVFMDNDVEVLEGWLEEMVKAADQEQVGCVHPIYLTTRAHATPRKIHIAEGKMVREKRNGKWFIDTHATYSGVKLEDYPHSAPRSSDFFEWHCALFRKSLLDKVGPLDDLTIGEHMDYSLRIEKAGDRILLVPKSVVAYDYERIWKLRGLDRDYLLFRWDVARAGKSLDRLVEKWNLVDESVARRRYWVKEHSAKVRSTYPVPRVINKIRRTIGLKNMNLVPGETKPERLKVTD